MIGDRLARDPMAPPTDALAEAVVLYGLLQSPHLIADYDPSLLLVFPEHKDVLLAMKRAYAATGCESWARFYMRFVAECESIRPGRGEALATVLDHTADDESRLKWIEYRRAEAPELGVKPYVHDWLWWWQRLKNVAECRVIVSKGHTVVDRAWKGDLEGALRAVQSIPSAPRLADKVFRV